MMNVATNPRLGAASQCGRRRRPCGRRDRCGRGRRDDGGCRSQCGRRRRPAGIGPDAAGNGIDPVEARLDPRTRPQKLLDGLVGGCKAALASGNLSAAGGLRPQIMATINYQDLGTARRQRTQAANSGQRTPGQGNPGPTDLGTATSAPPPPTAQTATGSLLFTGPVTASTVRKIACDADIIPVLLGGEGRVLDIGRASRVFPPHIRKAITARDQGCSFPQCTIPAPWCEAHHVTYWSRGGSTGTENGTLLCSHHHHLIHKEQWTIQMRSGIPWFIPPPHVDPGQNASPEQILPPRITPGPPSGLCPD